MYFLLEYLRQTLQSNHQLQYKTFSLTLRPNGNSDKCQEAPLRWRESVGYYHNE